MKTGTFLFLSFFIVVSLTVCPAAYSPSDMQSGIRCDNVGTITASTTNNNQIKLITTNNTYNHVLNRAFSRVPILTVGTEKFDSGISMLDRSIPIHTINVTQSTGQTTPGILGFNVILSNAPSDILTVRFTFLATTNNDFQVGFLNGNTIGSQTQELSANINQAVTNSVIISFFSGFAFSSIESSAAPTNFAIASRRSVDRTVRIGVTSSRSGIVSLGFVIYNQERANSNYLVTSGQGISETIFVNPNDKFAQLDLYIYGLSALAIGTNFYEIKRKTNSPYLQLFSSISMSASYLFIENLPRAYCTGCIDSTIYDGSGCVTGCLGNTVPVRVNSLYGYCKDCNIFNLMIPNKNRTDCVCADQTFAVNADVCRQCHFSCASCVGPSNKQCLTCDLMPSVGTNRYLVNSQCRCMQGYYDDVLTETCLNCSTTCLTCFGPTSENCVSCDDSKGRTLIAGQCQCKGGFEEQGGNCVFTGKDSSVPSPLPTITCPLNSALNNNTCVCNSNFIKVNDVCQPCPQNSLKSNETECRCQNNFANISNRCLRCPTNYIISNNSCICAPNSRQVSGACTPCPSNTILNGSVCQCNQRAILVNGACILCPVSSSKISPTACRCNQNYFNSSGQCVLCPTRSIVVSGVCQCPSNTVNINGSCQSCPQNSVLLNGKCQCDDKSISSNGGCQSCPDLTVKRGNNCVCAPNTFNVSGVCRQCPESLVKAANGSCVCPSNAVLDGGVCRLCAPTFIVSGNQCKCPQNFIISQGKCSACPEGLVKNGNSCQRPRETAVNPNNVVPPPQPEAQQQRTPVTPPTPTPLPPQPTSQTSRQTSSPSLPPELPPNSRIVNGQLTCIPQTYNVTGICRYCSTQTQLVSQGTCVCRQNFVRVNNFCRRLKQNERVQNGMIRCTEGHFNTSGLCFPCSGIFNETTERCQCRSGFIAVNGSCRRIGNCPAGMYSNGRSCICAIGSADNLGRCVDCGPRAIFSGWQCVCRQPGLNYSSRCSCGENSQIQQRNSCTCLDGFIEQGGRCVPCPPGSFWNGKNECSCPGSSILTSNGCQRCQAFSSPQNGGCMCDFGYTLRNGECVPTSQPTVCQPQTFWNAQSRTCQKCINLCEQCDNGFECKKCRQGSSLMNNNRACMEICGDGVRINTQCDDGNFNNGDGCSNQCIVEPGWNCTGGGPTSRDVCTRIQATSTLRPFPIQLINTLRYGSMILQIFSISYIPPELAANGCPLCTTILTTAFSETQAVPSVMGAFREPNTLAVLYNFAPRAATPFKVSIGINSNYWPAYSQYDLRQPLVVPVDPNQLQSLM